ncbi:alpha/beta hydrolase [Streptomyces sp. A0642]|uniref:alpha/beta hydrolase family protein n=1 Tax=Streptomyces sp. A0642 TaxID=2563100 RepID=UPI0010A22F40|nr:alpha/beta hydrolase [Streptomyces sp. A0642]THA78448.1 alpha/beta hydrolase [Streptomyces sp. A0642]
MTPRRPGHPDPRRAAAAVLLTLALSVPLSGTASAAPAGPARIAPRAAYSSGLELPPLTGPYSVGRRTLHLVDRSRTDPWVPASGHRELMVTVSYPARTTSGPPAAYMTDEEAQLLLEARGLGGVVPRAVVAGARTHARTDARPAAGRFPLVLLSPGFSMPRATLTSIAEDLASRGYVVALVDHAYESVGTAFPGGRILTCAACEQVGTREEQAAVVRVRAKDMSFVIDELTHGRGAGGLSRVIDPSRIGIGGHSIGGAAAAATMAADRRVRAGADLDGDFFVHPAGTGLGGRPFLMIGAASTHSPGAPTTDWSEAWRHLHGWKRWLTVDGAEHFSFTDLPYLAGQLGLSDPAVPLSGARGWRITRDYVSAFFGLHLRGMRQPLLDGPGAIHPEVAFQ